MGRGSGKSGDNDEPEDFEAEFEGLIDRGVPMVDLVALDNGDKTNRLRLKEALAAVEYRDWPANAYVLSGPFRGKPCDARTSTQREFGSAAEAAAFYAAKGLKVYADESRTDLGYWALRVGPKS